MITQTTKITVLYERLSKDDLLAGESMSIQNQKAMLEKYAADHGFGNVRHYSDDGTSGTVFNRPGLNAMIEEVKAGNVSTVIIKDQSRIGRDVLEVGLLKRTFEENDVRFIAANDNLDTARGFDIMSIFRDVFNEWYVADASKKIRAVKRSNALAGKCAGRPPYGYRAKDGKSNQEWEIDEYAAGIVREIFKRFVAGDGPHTIGKDLDRREILTPMVYYRRMKGLPPLNEDTTWFTYTVAHILENQAYIGNLVSQKTTTPSYKNHKKVNRSEEDWVVIKNHHIPIIDAEVFDTSQKLRANRRRQNSVGEFTALSGLIFCSDCNSKLAISCNTAKYQYYVCTLYRNSNKHYRNDCTRHGIRREDMERIALEKIQETVTFFKENKTKFADLVRKSTDISSDKALKSKKSELAKTDRRIAELDVIIKKTYESNVLGKLPDDLFAKFLNDYETEHKMLISSADALRTEVEEQQSKTADLQRFMKIVERHSDISELTSDIARSFIDKIVVHEAVYKETNPNVKVSQEIQIFFNCIGEFNAE